MKCMQGRFHVTCRRLIALGSKEGEHGDEVRASLMGKPANTPNQALVGVLSAFKGRRLVVFRRRRHRINWNAGTIRCRGRSFISVREMETFNQIGSKTRLIELDSDGQRGNLPGEVDPKKPVHNPHEVNLALFR
jgi:hypothetical protein